MPRGAPPLRGRGPLAVAVLLGTYLALSIAGVVLALAADPGVAKDRQVLLQIDGGAKILALAATGLVLRFAGGARDPGPAPARPAVAAGLAAALAFLPIMITASWIQERAWKAAGWKMEPQGIVDFAVKGSDLDFACVLLFAVVLAPVFEEILFRVHLYSGLRVRMGPLPAALLSAALFALFHLEPVAFPVTFLLGLCLAWLREKTGGRSAPIAMHACYNSVQMAGILALRLGGGPATGG